ncbi:hypothetical protein PLICRDRAFT_35750 [Plicaturopsis crispa FD-325 SS-3]|nr:hypothetical protein PLICRDRAFT_35750 [Plicaturopsis crispa FD-325 SS-3]
MLGGGSVDLNVKIVTPKPLSTALNIQHYICPKLSDNPWCPSTPGQHGYMFVGLGRDKDRYKDPQERNLFLGVASADFRYMGVYRVHAVSPLTVDEWNTLPDDFQKSYSFLTSSKNKFPGINWTPKECREAYDSGRLQVPCVQLTCVGFNDMLYRELAKSKPVSPGKKRPADSMPDGLPVPTRKSQRLSL